MPRRPILRIARDGGGNKRYVFLVGGEGPWVMNDTGYWNTSEVDSCTVWQSEHIHALWPYLEMEPGDGPREVDPGTMRFVD